MNQSISILLSTAFVLFAASPARASRCGGIWSGATGPLFSLVHLAKKYAQVARTLPDQVTSRDAEARDSVANTLIRASLMGQRVPQAYFGTLGQYHLDVWIPLNREALHKGLIDILSQLRKMPLRWLNQTIVFDFVHLQMDDRYLSKAELETLLRIKAILEVSGFSNFDLHVRLLYRDSRTGQRALDLTLPRDLKYKEHYELRPPYAEIIQGLGRLDADAALRMLSTLPSF